MYSMIFFVHTHIIALIATWYLSCITSKIILYPSDPICTFFCDSLAKKLLNLNLKQRSWFIQNLQLSNAVD